MLLESYDFIELAQRICKAADDPTSERVQCLLRLTYNWLGTVIVELNDADRSLSFQEDG